MFEARNPMIETPYERFLAATAGRYTVLESAFVWCASPSLCGAVLWGEPTEAETRAILHIFDGYPRQMASAFDIVLDTRGVVGVDPRGLAALCAWLVERRAHLALHLRMQANVIRQGPIGFLLTGVLPVVGWPVPYKVFHAPVDAFRAVAGDGAEALCAEVEAIAERARGMSRELRVTRELLERKPGLTLEEVSRALRTSARSLQRVLQRHGTSFHQEVVAARFTHAKGLLRASDSKIAAIGAQLGVSQRALTDLFREKTGLSPAAWRRRHRGG